MASPQILVRIPQDLLNKIDEKYTEALAESIKNKNGSFTRNEFIRRVLEEHVNK